MTEVSNITTLWTMGKMFRNVYAVGLDESSPRIDKSV